MRSGGVEPVEEVHPLEGIGEVLTAALVVGLRIPHAGAAQRRVHDLPDAHVEAGMLGAEPLGQLADHEVILARLAGRFDQLAGDLEGGVAAGGVEVVVLEEGGGGQHHVGEGRGLGHELLVHAGEQILARQAGVHLVQLGADHRRVGVLHQQRRHRRPALQRLRVAGEDRPQARLVELADRAIDHVEPFDQRAVERIDAGVAVERAAALDAARRR